MIGTMFGPYRVESLLGRGGMGEVYRAVDSTQGRAVALKVLPESMSDDGDFVARFRREAEIAARVADPHVVPIHRYGEIGGRLFLDMQLVDGRELGAVLAAEGPLPPARAVALVAQVAAALDAAHADGLVHRDVKPSNVLVTDPGKGRAEFAYLVDFGIARPTDLGSRTALTRTGAVVGTLAYMAPERFLAQPSGPPADVYALACVLHELLTGERPFPGTGYGPQVHGHLELPPPRPSTMAPGVPAAFDAVIAVGMAKEPTSRHRTAGELAAHAQSALTDRRVPALPDTVVPAWRPPATPRRRRGRLVAAGAAAVAVVVAVTLTVTLTRPAATTAPVAPAVAAAGLTDQVVLMREPSGPMTGIVAGDRPLMVARDQIGGPVVTIDLATGESVQPAIADASGIGGVTAAEVGGRAVTVTGGYDAVVRLWDTATGNALPTTITGPIGSVGEVVVATVDGRAVVVTVGNSSDPTIRRYDLATGAPIGEPFGVGSRRIQYAQVVTVEGRSVLIAQTSSEVTSHDYRMWDIATGAPVGAGPVVLSGSGSRTTGLIDGRPVVVSSELTPDGQGLAYYVRDLGTGETTTHPAEDSSTGVELFTAGDRPLVARSTYDGIALVDARTWEPVGDLLVGHESSSLYGMTTLDFEGRTYLLSTGSDETVRLWDVTARIEG